MVEVAERRATFRSGRSFEEGAAVWALAVASGVAGALAGTHATGTPVLDPLYAALLAAVVTAAGGFAGRATVLWLAAIAAGFSRGYEIFAAAAGLLLAFASVVPRRSIRPLSALSAAVAVQVVLRWPHFGFQGASALVAAAAVAPCLLHAVVLMPRRRRRVVVWGSLGVLALAVVLCIPLAVEAALARNDASRGTIAAEDALHAVSSGNASGGRDQLAAAHADFAAVARKVGAWWTAGARLVPIVAQQRQAVVAGAQVARDVAYTASQQSQRIDFGSLHYQSGGLDLNQVAALAGPLNQVDQQLTDGVARLRSANSSWLVGPLESRLQLLTSHVVKAQGSASLASEVVEAAPGLLGGDGPRHYLVALQDPAESRGLGGLIVSYGLVTASNGHVAVDQFSDISQFNAAVQEHGGATITAPADFVARYGQNPSRYAQNVTYSPDLPTVTQVMSQLYAKAGYGKLDGMMVLDPRSLAALLNFTGDIQAPGLGTLTAANTDELLEKGQYALYPSASQQTERRNALDGALHTALSRLAEGSLPTPASLASTLGPDVASGDLLFWSMHPDEQEMLERTGLAGRFPAPHGGDLLAVTTANTAANKIDPYLQRTITSDVHYSSSNGDVSETVQVVLHNGAPATGLSSEVIGSYAGSRVPPGTNWTWVTFYSPLHLDGANLSASPLQMSSQTEFGVAAYSAFIKIGPGATQTVTVHLHGRVSAGGYRLHVYSQPMVLPDKTQVDVSISHGRSGITQSVWSPTERSRAYRFFS